MLSSALIIPALCAAIALGAWAGYKLGHRRGRAAEKAAGENAVTKRKGLAESRGYAEARGLPRRPLASKDEIVEGAWLALPDGRLVYVNGIALPGKAWKVDGTQVHEDKRVRVWDPRTGGHEHLTFEQVMTLALVVEDGAAEARRLNAAAVARAAREGGR